MEASTKDKVAWAIAGVTAMSIVVLSLIRPLMYLAVVVLLLCLYIIARIRKE